MDGKKIFGLVLTIALALFFIGPMGLGKLLGLFGTDVAAQAEMFGYSAGFMTLVGGLELLGGVGLLLPQTRKLAVLGLIGLMLGAAFTHVRTPGLISGLPIPIVTAIALFLALKLNPAEARTAAAGD